MWLFVVVKVVSCCECEVDVVVHHEVTDWSLSTQPKSVTKFVCLQIFSVTSSHWKVTDTPQVVASKSFFLQPSIFSYIAYVCL